MILEVPNKMLPARHKNLWRRLAPKFPHLEQSDTMRFALFVSGWIDFLDEMEEVEAMTPGEEKRKGRASLRLHRSALDKMIDQLGVKTRSKEASPETAEKKPADFTELLSGVG